MTGNPPIDWLLEHGDAWVQYRARVDVMCQPETDPAAQTARAAMLVDPRIGAVIDTLADWPGPPLKSHKQAGHHLHRLAFLAEIGLRASDPGMAIIVEGILARQSADGVFQIAIHITRGAAASDTPIQTWMLCDAPLTLWALCQLGVDDDPRVARAANHIAALIRDNGWPCASDPAIGFRGPGRKSDPCPYSTLLCLKALAAYGPERLADPGIVDIGIKALLTHWETQKERKLYLFGIGTDFRKPKFPLVWYDILHVVDVLSQYPAARYDPRYQAMLAALMNQADGDGRFTAASMYQDWKTWEFANKKQPSPAITLIAWRAALRGNHAG
jgi:hypothetical protein